MRHAPVDAPPPRVLLVGAGGFGREVRWWAGDALAGSAARIVGFLDADASRGTPDLPVVGDPATHEPRPDEAFVLAIGIPHVRRRVAETLLGRGARFLALVHPTAIVVPSARVGPGAVVCPGAIVSDAAEIGPFGLVNYHASVAHDAAVGAFAVLSPYATLAGGAAVGEDTFLGLHASVGPGRRVGDRGKVAANSCALVDVPPDSLVYGVPGRVSRLFD